MDIDSLTTTHIKRAIDLLSKKEALQAQLSTLDEEITNLLGGGAQLARAKTATNGAKSKNNGNGRPKGKTRGALKEKILAELRSAGATGVSVKDLVAKLSKKSANLHAWFNMTGKNIPGLSKIGRGIYRLVE